MNLYMPIPKRGTTRTDMKRRSSRRATKKGNELVRFDRDLDAYITKFNQTAKTYVRSKAACNDILQKGTESERKAYLAAYNALIKKSNAIAETKEFQQSKKEFERASLDMNQKVAEAVTRFNNATQEIMKGGGDESIEDRQSRLKAVQMHLERKLSPEGKQVLANLVVVSTSRLLLQ